MINDYNVALPVASRARLADVSNPDRSHSPWCCKLVGARHKRVILTTIEQQNMIRSAAWVKLASKN